MSNLTSGARNSVCPPANPVPVNVKGKLPRRNLSGDKKAGNGLNKKWMDERAGKYNRRTSYSFLTI